MPSLVDALSSDRNGTLIAIEVSANAKAAHFPDGYNPWRNAIGCRVAAPATGGKANRAVLALISEVLGVPQSSVTLVAGQTSTQKKVLVFGLAPKEVAGRLTDRS